MLLLWSFRRQIDGDNAARERFSPVICGVACISLYNHRQTIRDAVDRKTGRALEDSRAQEKLTPTLIFLMETEGAGEARLEVALAQVLLYMLSGRLTVRFTLTRGRMICTGHYQRSQVWLRN